MTDDLKTRYDKDLASEYDKGSPSFVLEWKRLAFSAANLKEGDSVVVFCCGTGRDFALIRQYIGETGRILGLDFSQGMLDIATEMVKKQGWDNVELRHADVVNMEPLGELFDAAVCTLGLSTIPSAEKAYENLKNNVKPGGTVIVGDYQLTTGWRWFFNPILISFCRKFGGSYKNHKRSLRIFRQMHIDLNDIREQQFMFNSYRYCIGVKDK